MSIQVTALLNPFTQERTEYTFESGVSVAEILAKIDAAHAAGIGFSVLFDDEPVTDFNRVPADCTHVYLKLVPQGDTKEQGKGLGWAGVGLAALGIALTVFTGGTGALIGVALIGAGVGMLAGGVALYNIDIPTADSSSTDAPEQDPSIRGSRNQTRTYGQVPVLFGKRRIYPDLAASSHTWVDPETGSAYLYQLFCVGQKGLVIDTDSIKIDETLLKEYSASGDIDTVLSGNDALIDMRIHNDGSCPVLVTDCVHEEQVNAIIKHETDEGADGSVTRTTPDGTEELNVDIFFYNGLGKYNDSGNVVDTSVEMGAWYKKADEDDSAYQLLGYFTNTASVTYTNSYTLKYSGPAKITQNLVWNCFSAWQLRGSATFTLDASTKSAYTMNITRVQKCGGSKKNGTLSYRLVYFTLSYTEAPHGSNTLTAHELKTKRYAITKTGLEAASYTVKVSRITADATDTKIVDSVYLGAIRAIKHESPVNAEMCESLTLVELKIKASEKLNGMVEQLNFVAHSPLPVYAGTGTGAAAWETTAQSSNPASAMLYALTGDMAQQKADESMIDWAAFEKLYLWCASHGYECNAYLAESMTVSALLSAIASTCRTEALRMNGKHTVIQDIARGTVMQLFTPRNSHDYKETLALAEIPDEMRLAFTDEEKGYAENTCSVYNSSTGNRKDLSEWNGTTQDVSLWGVTNSAQARRLGMYKYAVSKHRPIVRTFSCDFEYLMCQKGDLIHYAGDVALSGITQGRITARILDDDGNVTGFETDEAITTESGTSYGIRVRTKGGDMQLLDVTARGTTENVLMLQESVAADDAPDEGDLFTFGVRGNESIALVVTDIQCGENLSAELVCVDYSPEIFGVDEDGFVLPDFENYLSETTGAVDTGAVSGWKTYTTFSDSSDMPDAPARDGTSGGWHYVQTASSKWMSQKTAESASAGVWGTPTPLGQYAVEKIQKIVGDEGGVDVGEPDTVSAITALATRDGITVRWNPVSDNGLRNAIKQYTLEVSRDSGTTWSALADVYDSSYSYTFTRTGMGADGYPEASALAAWLFRVKAENVYGKISEAWAVAPVDTASYGTWIPAVAQFTLKEADEGGITLSWNAAESASSGRTLYGTNTYRVIVSYNGVERARHETESRAYTYDFDRSVDGYPEKPTVTGAAVTLDRYTVQLTVINESGAQAAGTAKPIDYDNYKTWIPLPLTGDYAVRGSVAKRAVTLLFPPQSDAVYGSLLFGVTVSRRSTDVSGSTQLFYTPNLTKDCYSDIDSYKDATTTPIFTATSFKQNVPLLGQDMQSIQLDRYDVDFRDGQAVTDATGAVEQYASSREYYVYDSDGIAAFKSVYGAHSAININSILATLASGGTVTDYTWTREGGTSTDYTVCHMTISLIATPMPDDTEYIYRVYAKNSYGGATTATADVSVTATAQSAADLVDKAITANKLDDQSVTTEKIAAGAITAEEIAAVNLLAKGATAGNMTAEGLQVPDSGFWAGKNMRYDYTDPNGNETTYTAEAGEFFVGNNPAHETAGTDSDTYLHFIPSTKQFFLAIKNIVFQSLATIVKGIFRVKASLSDTDAASFMTVNPTTSADNGTPAKTVKVAGTVSATTFCGALTGNVTGNVNGRACCATCICPVCSSANFCYPVVAKTAGSYGTAYATACVAVYQCPAYCAVGIAFGAEKMVSGLSSIVVGTGEIKDEDGTTHCQAVMVGHGAQNLSDIGGVAVGYNALVHENYSVAVGYFARNIDVSLGGSVSIGACSEADYSSVAVGCNAMASDCSAAVGQHTCAWNYGVAVGYCAWTRKGQCNIAIGYLACAACDDVCNGIALGTCAQVHGNGAIHIGTAACCPVIVCNGAIRIGLSDNAVNSQTVWQNSILIGRNSCSNSFNTVAIGYCACACEHSNVAIGSCTYSNLYATSVGAFNSASCFATAIGSCACAGEFGIAGGFRACADACSVAMGSRACADACSVAMGYCARAYAYSIAIGEQACSTQTCGIAIGRRAFSATWCNVLAYTNFSFEACGHGRHGQINVFVPGCMKFCDISCGFGCIFACIINRYRCNLTFTYINGHKCPITGRALFTGVWFSAGGNASGCCGYGCLKYGSMLYNTAAFHEAIYIRIWDSQPLVSNTVTYLTRVCGVRTNSWDWGTGADGNTTIWTCGVIGTIIY